MDEDDPIVGGSARRASSAAMPATAARRGRLVPTLAAAIVLSATVSLGNWQMRRADEKVAMQAAQDRAERAGPIELGAAMLAADALDGRKVAASGRWVDASTVFLDNRTHAGVAGFQVFTALRLDDPGVTAPRAEDGSVASRAESGPAASRAGAAAPMHVLVLRGWVPRDPVERTRLPVLPAAGGSVRIEGVGQAHLAGALQLGDASQAREGPGGRIWQAVSLAQFSQWSGLALQPVVVRQTGGPPDGLVREAPQPGVGAERHRGYAVQWYAMAAATAALWLYFGWFRRNGRSNPDE